MKYIQTYHHFYFVGIGGIGMSALARYFQSIGKSVMGYDKTPTKLTKALESEGISIVFDDVIPNSLSAEDTLVIYTIFNPNNSPF